MPSVSQPLPGLCISSRSSPKSPGRVPDIYVAGGSRQATIWEAWGLHCDILGVHLGTLGHHFDDPRGARGPQTEHPCVPGVPGTLEGSSVVTVCGACAQTLSSRS